MPDARLLYIINRTGAVLGLIGALFFVAHLSSSRVSALECPLAPLLPSAKECCCEEAPPPPPAVPVAVDLCTTDKTSIAMPDRDVLFIFSGRMDGNPNGMLVTQISLKSIRAVTDEEKAMDKRITLVSKESEFADDGWYVELYWFNNHYGIIVTGPNGFYDDTNNCITF